MPIIWSWIPGFCPLPWLYLSLCPLPSLSGPLSPPRLRLAPPLSPSSPGSSLNLCPRVVPHPAPHPAGSNHRCHVHLGSNHPSLSLTRSRFLSSEREERLSRRCCVILGQVSACGVRFRRLIARLPVSDRAVYFLRVTLSPSLPQRPYVMRSSTPANELLQTFHKVHPCYPVAWSLEIKSLFRKVWCVCV